MNNLLTITDAALELASVLSLSAIAVLLVMAISWFVGFCASHPIDTEEEGEKND